jgi:ATP-dependent RNA helicase SUPV3L1/SUV3
VSKLKNRVENFVILFEKLNFNDLFSKYLNIEKEILTFDIIKSFEEHFCKDKKYFLKMALEFYAMPRTKSYFKMKNDVNKNLKFPRTYYPHIKKIDILQKEFEQLEIINFDIKNFIDYFIFFEPFCEYIKANLKNHRRNIEISKKVLTINKPQDYFPYARKLKRKFIYHFGPTNSGKTSNAIKRLTEAKSGIYCAPLRLLAWEVYEKMKGFDVACNLSTGQDRIYMTNATHVSMTIEKADLRKHYEVAVIDEIQMIEDEERGSAWTNAILGLRADEIHLCGDERALYLIKELCKETGDELYYKSYNRFSNLIVENSCFDYNNLKPGDCIISFSKIKIMNIKRNIINQTKSYFGDSNNNSVAVIYGDLPSDTKKDQANTFNKLTFSPEHQRSIKYDYLVATDAVRK